MRAPDFISTTVNKFWYFKTHAAANKFALANCYTGFNARIYDSRREGADPSSTPWILKVAVMWKEGDHLSEAQK